MAELTQEQLLTVNEIVSNSDITYSHLPDDLIDHICCDIESEMSVGLSFNKALERVQCKFGDSGLQRIQEDTILLIDQKYRFMKTTMKIFGNVSLALIGLGTIFKILNWPGASIGLSLGFLLLGLIFYPATILASYRKRGRKNLFLHILAILGGIFLMFGILFKIQHWPGASKLLVSGWVILLLLFLPIWFIKYAIQSKNQKETGIYAMGVIGVIIFELSALFKIQHWPGASIMLIVGAILIVLVFLPLYVKNIYKKTDFVSGRFIYIIIGISFFLMFGTLVSINFEKKVWSSVSYTDYYAQIEKEYFNKSNLEYFNANSSDQSLKEIHHKTEELTTLINNIKRELIVESNADVDTYLNNIDLISDKGQYAIVDQLFFSEEGEQYAKKLKHDLLAYKSVLIKGLDQNQIYIQEINHLFKLDDSENEVLKTWEDKVFKASSLYTTLIKLSNIDRNIHLAENLFISYHENNQVDVKE